MVTVAMPIADRIHSSIRVSESGCWLWQGALDHGGYGVMTVGSRSDGSRRRASVHRVAYEEFVGPIPDDLQIDHLCRTRACCNPDHLEPVTEAENRRRIPPRARCPHNHPLTGDNLLIVRGARVCRACKRAIGRRSEAKRRERRRQNAG